MSVKLSFTTILPYKEVKEFMELFFDEHVVRHNNSIVHPALVDVNYGDGIGFDTGNIVFVTNSRNNVEMLHKSDYQRLFKPCQNLKISYRGITNIDKLRPGHTYIVYDVDGTYAFIKYLGNHVILMRSSDTVSCKTINNQYIPPHFEITKKSLRFK